MYVILEWDFLSKLTPKTEMLKGKHVKLNQMHKKFSCENIPKEKSQKVVKKLGKIFTLDTPWTSRILSALFKEFQ